MTKKLFLDVETTTLDEKNAQGGIYSLSYLYEVDNLLIGSGNIFFNPSDELEIDKDVLKFMEENGIDWEAIYGYQDSASAFKEFLNLLEHHVSRFKTTDKMFLYGYNIKFDERFLREWFVRNGNQYYGAYFWNNSIDVMTLVGEMLAPYREKFPNFKLETVCALFDIEIKAHGSESDIRATYNLYKAFQERCQIILE